MSKILSKFLPPDPNEYQTDLRFLNRMPRRHMMHVRTLVVQRKNPGNLLKPKHEKGTNLEGLSDFPFPQ